MIRVIKFWILESVLQIYDHRLSFDIATEFSTGRFHGISNEEDIHRAHVGKNVRGEGKRLEKQSFVLYNRYSLYNAVFNYRGKCARNTAHGNDLVVFLLSSPFFSCAPSLDTWNSNRNHDESCTYRFNAGPASSPFPPASTVKKKRARRVWHRETASISRRNQGWTLLSIHSPLNRALFWIGIGNKNTVERNRTWKMYSKACRKQLLWKLCDPKFLFQSISKIKKEERF